MSFTTLLMCLVGWLVHWLFAYGRARSMSRQLGTLDPGLWWYWYADWPTTVANTLIVFSGYFMLPEIAQTFPELAQLVGWRMDEQTEVTLLTAFMWGCFGSLLADVAGRRALKLLK